MTERVLLIEGEESTALPLVRALEYEGYEVRVAPTGQAGIESLAAAPVDLVILDLGLSDLDGGDLCRSARQGGFGGAILVVSARDRELDRVVALDSGADDYLTKPFGLAELQARLRALLRRLARNGVPPADDADASTALRIDVAARRVYVGAEEIALSGKEFDVLGLLMSHREKVVHRDELMSRVWDENWHGSTKTLDVTIGRLRRKLLDAGVREQVVAVRGIGFRLERSRDLQARG